MKFEITQRFDASTEEVMGLYCDPDFYPLLDGVGQIGGPEVLDRTVDDDGRIAMQIRFRFTGDLPSAALAIVRPEKLTWVEHTTFDTESGTSTTKIVPDHYPDRLQASARSTFTEADGGSLREVTGDLKVHALLVGGQVEKAIVSGMKDHLVEEAKVANRRLGGG